MYSTAAMNHGGGRRPQRESADDTVSGAITGSWQHRGNNLLDITLSGVIYNGVLSRQWSSNANAFVVSFSVLAAHGVSWWGARTGN